MRTFAETLALTIALCAFLFALPGCMASDAPSASQSSSASTEAASEAAEAESSAAEEPAAPDNVFETPLFRITLPEDIAKNAEFDLSQENRVAAYYGDVELFEVAAYDTYDGEAPWRHRIYSCGYGADKSGWHEVSITFPYITADGTSNAVKTDKRAKALALTYLLGAQEIDVYTGVEIQVASGDRLSTPRWDQSYPVLVSDDADADDIPSKSSSSKKKSSSTAADDDENDDKARDDEKDDKDAAKSDTHAAFWGVWVGAYSDAGNAQAAASEARAAGFSGAAVYVSTDWSDLNGKRFYVVSLQECGSESDAAAVLKKAKKTGYKDAYAKYTGDYRG